MLALLAHLAQITLPPMRTACSHDVTRRVVYCYVSPRRCATPDSGTHKYRTISLIIGRSSMLMPSASVYLAGVHRKFDTGDWCIYFPRRSSIILSPVHPLSIAPDLILITSYASLSISAGGLLLCHSPRIDEAS